MIYSLNNGTIKQLNKSFSCIHSDNVIRISYTQSYLERQSLYYTICHNDFICGNDFFELVIYLRKLNVRIELETGILNFFLEKGYAPFDYTIIKGIFKLPNLVSLILDKNNYSISYSLERIESDDQDDLSVIENSIRSCLDVNRKNVILFSGGYDSTLLALISRKYLPLNKIELVTGKIQGNSYKPNIDDVKYSKVIATYLGLEHHVVSVDLHDIEYPDLDKIIYSQPNSAHFSIVFEKINSEYISKGCHFISGQQADSILNFGFTSFVKFDKGRIEGIGELLRRYIYLSNSYLCKNIFRFLNPQLSSHCFQLSLMCGERKFPLIKGDEKKQLYYKLSDAYDSFLFKFSKQDKNRILNSFQLFYIFTHISGSDASAILNNIETNGNPLPFNQKELISHFILKHNSYRDKYIPKRPIMDLIKNEDVKLYDLIRRRPNTPNISYLDNFCIIGRHLNLNDYFARAEAVYNLKLPYCYNAYHLYRCLDKIYEL